MGVEYFQSFQEVTYSPGNGNKPAGNGRGEGDLVETNLTVWKKFSNFLGLQAARLGVDGIEPKIVGKDQSTRLHDAYHVGTDMAADFRIEDGGNRCKLHHQVESPGRKRQRLSIRIGQS